MEHKLTEIDGVVLPYVTSEEGVDYYPIRYVLEKVLLKSKGLIHRDKEYIPYIKTIVIDFSCKGTTPQECGCMSKEGWIKYVNNCIVNKNKNEEKIARLELWSEWLGVGYKSKVRTDYNSYVLDCISIFKKRSSKVITKTCSSCERNFPNSKHFFYTNNRNSDNTVNVCIECKGGIFDNYNEEHKYVYETFGLEAFELYLEDEHDFYLKYEFETKSVKNKKIKLNKKINEEKQKKIFLDTAKRMYTNGSILNEDLSKSNVRNLMVIDIISLKNISNNELIEYCTDNMCKDYPWRFPFYKSNNNIIISDAIIQFKRYLKDINMTVDDFVNSGEYNHHISKSRLNGFSSDALGFIVELYNREIAGYKFPCGSINYYKLKENRIFDMKWFVEKDLQVPIHKIPLYVTRYSLNKKASSLYRVIDKYYSSLFEWINECYPKEFNINDFEINPYRSEFDSLEEAQVDDILRSQFDNVLYNVRNSKYTINLFGMQPDWIIVSEKGTYLVEYFGLYSKNTKSSHRLQKYENKLSIKIEKYKELEKNGYKIIHIYPEDLREDNKKLIEKLIHVKNN